MSPLALMDQLSIALRVLVFVLTAAAAIIEFTEIWARRKR